MEGFRAGVDVYLTKPFEPDELVAVIQKHFAACRAHAFDDCPTRRQRRKRKPFSSATKHLTEAEWRVAETVARGLSNKEIAAELNLSVRTVENHVSRILAKKNFTNRVEIARHILSKSEYPNLRIFSATDLSLSFTLAI